MRRIMLWVVLLGAFACTSLHGQEIAEAWQGTLGAGPGIRVVLKISKGSDGSLGANLYILDQDPHRIPVTSPLLLIRSTADTRES
jgi:hypothetical protein